MSRLAEVLAGVSLPPFTPTLEAGVPGPRGQEGFLLRAPTSEALQWDLENEILSTGRQWLEDRKGWWIARRYLETVVDIVLRTSDTLLVLDQREGDRLLRREGDQVVQEPV